MSSQLNNQFKMAHINTEIKEALVSVIVTTYDRQSYLKQALESAIRQTYRNIEIIVSDNCSPENPKALVESFQDSRIQFWRNETNIGSFANAISAFKKARGKYVTILMDDDLWEEDFLEKLVLPLEENPDLALAFCDHYIINSNSEIDYLTTEKCTRFYKRDLLKEGVYQPFYEIALVYAAVPIMAMIIRRDVVQWDDIPPEVDNSWDVYLNYLCCRSGRGAYYYPERLTRVREHAQSQTMLSGKKDVQAKIRKAKAELACYERFIADEQLQEFKPHFQQKWAYANTSLGIGLLRTKQLKGARPYFWRALRQKFDLRTMAALILSFTPAPITYRF